MSQPNVFHVFRRFPDGYVNAICGDARRLSDSVPHGTMNGQRTTFQVLLSTENWAEAKRMIQQERAA